MQVVLLAMPSITRAISGAAQQNLVGKVVWLYLRDALESANFMAFICLGGQMMFHLTRASESHSRWPGRSTYTWICMSIPG